MPSSDVLTFGGIVAAVLAAVYLLRPRMDADAADLPKDMTIPPIDAPLYSARALSKSQQLVADKIIDAAWLANLNPAFMLALALTESSLNPRAIGDDGISLGLFQLQVGTARDHEPVDRDALLTTDSNIRIALKEMKRLMAVYPGQTYGDYAEAWTLGGRGRFVLHRRNLKKLTRMHEAITTLDLHLSLNEVPS